MRCDCFVVDFELFQGNQLFLLLLVLMEEPRTDADGWSGSGCTFTVGMGGTASTGGTGSAAGVAASLRMAKFGFEGLCRKENRPFLTLGDEGVLLVDEAKAG